MASIPQILGPRPAKVGIGHALSKTLEAGGAYYGQLAIEKSNAEALAAVRDYDERMRREQQEREDAKLAEQRTYTEGRQEAAWAREDNIRAEENAREDATREQARTLGNSTETVVIDGKPHKVRLDAGGNVVKDLGPDPDYTIGQDGQLQRLSAGGKGATERSQTESQQKYGIHARNLQSGLDVMKATLGGGYDLQSFEAFRNQAAAAAGGLGNWLTTKQGRAYHTGLVRAAEALFKGESGAAGSDAEAARYQSLFPIPGDDPTTVDVKLQLMEISRQAFREASGQFSSRDDLVMFNRAAADEAASQLGYVITPEGIVRVDASATGGSGARMAAGGLDLQGLVQSGVLSADDAAYLGGE